MRSGTDAIHEGYVHSRRARVLAGWLAPLIPQGAKVLDVGCGDGLLAWQILSIRPDIAISGIDVLIRPQTHIPVQPFDGQTFPHEDRSIDVVLFVDVLHHTKEPTILLREASRVARESLLIKDHLREGLLARTTLRFMDRVGNARHRVASPHNYRRRREWLASFEALGLSVANWYEKIGLYPGPADRVFGRSLHFIARLEIDRGEHRSAMVEAQPA